MKISGVSPPYHDDAVRALETVANAIMYEIDLRYGVLVMLMSSRLRIPPPVRRRLRPLKEPPSLPRFKYQTSAKSILLCQVRPRNASASISGFLPGS